MSTRQQSISRVMDAGAARARRDISFIAGQVSQLHAQLQETVAAIAAEEEVRTG